MLHISLNANNDVVSGCQMVEFVHFVARHLPLITDSLCQSHSFDFEARPSVLTQVYTGFLVQTVAHYT